MTPHALLTKAKQRLATGAGQTDKTIAICFALDRATYNLPRGQRKAARVAANTIKDEVMDYLAPHLTFREKLSATHTNDQIQLARHQYLDQLIEREAKCQ